MFVIEWCDSVKAIGVLKSLIFCIVRSLVDLAHYFVFEVVFSDLVVEVECEFIYKPKAFFLLWVFDKGFFIEDFSV